MASTTYICECKNDPGCLLCHGQTITLIYVPGLGDSLVFRDTLDQAKRI